MITKASHHIDPEDTFSARVFDGPSGPHVAIAVGQTYPDTILYLRSAAQAVAAGLTIVADLLPDLTAVELVAARHGIDSLIVKATALAAILEHETADDLRSIEADERALTIVPEGAA